MVQTFSRSNEVGSVHFSFRRVFLSFFCEQRTVFWGTLFCYVTLMSKKYHTTELKLENAQPFPFQMILTLCFNCHVFYNTASSLNGQDEPNRALWLATRAGKMELSCPLGTTRCSCKKNFPKSHIINPLLTKLVLSRWLYLTSHSVNYPFVLIKFKERSL